MKLHITPEQFREFSKDGQEILREYAMKKSNNNKEPYLIFGEPLLNDEQVYIVSGEQKKSSDFKKDYAVCLNIGQMIEFLNEKNGNIWGALVRGYDDFFLPVEEWCDSLWKAVKEVINGQN